MIKSKTLLTFALATFSLAAFTLTGCNKFGSTKLSSDKDKVSYGIGQDIGRSIKQQSIDLGDLNLDKLKAGIEDVLAGKKSPMTDQELTQVMMAFQQKMMAKHDSVTKIKGDENQKASDAFFAQNSKVNGVITLPDGLQYQIITAGTGQIPDSNNTVTVNYQGMLLDGTIFDSSIARGQPATFPVRGVIRGWSEILQMMPKGSKWKVFIPSNLAYGANGAGDKIGPNAALIFEVELLAVD